MSAERKIRGARVLASHCAELVPPPRAAGDADEAVREFAEAAARALAGPLGELMGGVKPRVTCAAAERADASNCVTEHEGAAAHFLIGDPDGPHALTASIGGRDALALCDRAFGGSGDIGSEAPQVLPASAGLTLKRFGAMLASAIGSALGEGREAVLKRQDGKLVKLIPFARIGECFVVDLNIDPSGGNDAAAGEEGSWTIRLLADARALPAWLSDAAAGSPVPAARRAPAHPARSPFGDIPIELCAVLAELKLPVSRISALRPGATIALPLRREVPLRIGGHDIATGTIGTLDERMALRIGGADTFRQIANGEDLT
ncbi:MAG: FliM/FliN family flagellar motor switch protein [Alteripontixanthobacter sp.]